jgi:hypothetical protein
MRMPLWAAVLAAAVVLGQVFDSRPARARAEADTYCTLTQTFGASLRYLRVDLGYKVIEKDPDAAYILFKYPVPGESKQQVQGAIELIKVEKKVRIVVTIPKMPRLYEQLLRDGLLKKLADEYGDVNHPSQEKPKETAPDAGPK